MTLDFLIFDTSDEAGGRAAFDALASVPAARLPALLGEVEAVLQWAQREFGPPAQGDDDAGDWTFDLQATIEPDAPLPIAFGAASGRVRPGEVRAGERVTVSLTLGGSPAFAEALRQAFELE